MDPPPAGLRAPQYRSADSEARLLALARKGDDDAFIALVDGHDRVLRALAFRLLGSEAAVDDVLQDGYLKAYRALPEFAGRSSIGTWLHRIVYTSCLDELRRAQRRPSTGLEVVETLPAADGCAAARVSDRVALAIALDSLDPELRAIVVMTAWQGLTRDEVAETLGIPPGTVTSRLARARAALRRALTPCSEEVDHDA